jgi:hypothetical protein
MLASSRGLASSASLANWCRKLCVRSDDAEVVQDPAEPVARRAVGHERGAARAGAQRAVRQLRHHVPHHVGDGDVPEVAGLAVL